jgi:PKHD-type hydroxylase
MKDEHSYRWVSYSWPEQFTEQEIVELNKAIENNVVGIEDKNSNAYQKKKNISSVEYVPYGKIKHLISDLVHQAYQVANLDFGYQTFGPHDDIYLNLNTYDSDTQDDFPWHIDQSTQPTNDIKLTLVINLSTEPFTGGEFQLTAPSNTLGEPRGMKIPLLSEPGSAFMFKSHILHKVTPVTSGTRKSLTMFIHGPKFT